jgi:diaminopimelate epimerase
MATSLEFEKYEGLGNDFIVVDADAPLTTIEVKRLCDRHFGIGADGVLVVGTPKTSGARATMVVQNADGSRPEMCGNGLRCVARRDGLERMEYVVDTDAGPRRCTVERKGDTASVALDMGQASVVGEHRAELDGHKFTFQRMSIGNPHAVSFGGVLDLATVDRVGPMVSGQIPGGTNVEFVERRAPGVFDVVVWERGVGRTLACGTGAAATGAALALAGFAPYGSPIQIRLPGGPLEVTITQGTLAVRLQGPAQRVFSGRLTEP